MDTILINQQPLAEALSKACDERDSLQRVVATDAENLKQSRLAIDAASATIWEDVYRQQLAATDRKSLTAALKLAAFGNYSGLFIAVFIFIGIGVWLAGNALAVLLPFGLYVILASVNFFIARGQAVGLVKAAQKSLGADGKDLRLVAFARQDPALEHPLVGFDGPTAQGELQSRSWQITALRPQEALDETFFEVMDCSGVPVMLARLPGKTPTHVFADTANGFVNSFGSYLQKALERRLGLVSLHAKAFRGAVLRYAQLDDAQIRCADMQREVDEYEGVRSIWKGFFLPPELKLSLDLAVQHFRLGAMPTSRSLLLYGPPGGGKSRLAEAIARTAGATLVRIWPADAEQGAERLGELFLASQSRSVVFIDECERAVSPALRAAWDAIRELPNVWIIGATAQAESLDPTIRSRFGLLLEVPLPDNGARRAIFEAHTQHARSSVPISESLVQATTGMSSRELEDIVTIALQSEAETLTDIDMLAIVGRVRDRNRPDETPSASWNTLHVGPATVERLQTLAAMFAHAATMRAQGIEIPHGVLLYGPDELDKAAVVHMVAQESGLTQIVVVPREIEGCFERAREQAPAILFFDALDLLIPRSEIQLGNSTVVKLVGEIIQEMDAIKWHAENVFLIGTATTPERMEEAVRSRFSEAIEMPLFNPGAHSE